MALTDTRRLALNEQRLLNAYAGMRTVFRAILADMEAQGQKPLVAENLFRTLEEQRQLVREGKSKVLFSFHTVTGGRGEPESLAMDVCDARTPFNEPVSFFLRLAASARKHGLETGARFGLNAAQTAFLMQVLDRRQFDQKVSLGWDPWHVQPRPETLTLAEAKAGKRPTFKEQDERHPDPGKSDAGKSGSGKPDTGIPAIQKPDPLDPG